jgi:exopolysaccharide biosynthesis polyprenyl glycosylphosphotransferase
MTVWEEHLPATSYATTRGPARVRQSATEQWARKYATRLLITDAAIIIAAVSATQLIWFGFSDSKVSLANDSVFLGLTYTAISMVLVVAWLAVLALFATRDSRLIGSGPGEYRTVVDATIRLFGVGAIVVFLLKIDMARGYFIAGLPLALAGLLLGRWLWRKWLVRQRMNGNYLSRVLLVGSRASVITIAKELEKTRKAGYLVVGACIPGNNLGDYLPGGTIQISSDLERLSESIRAADADTVIVTSSEELSSTRIRELSWSLEPGRQHLVVAPGLTDIGGPRIHVRPVAGLPLVHVETPRYEGPKRFTKRSFDLIGAALLIVLFSPMLLIVAIAVKFSSNGPIFYGQERVGLNGKPFVMLKFRSMRHGADEELSRLLEAQGTMDRPLFKIRDDPRVTRVGEVLRKYSLDEFPQLFNVLSGEMSLVGPRPQREGEVALYDKSAHRRLFVQPGMTGLWQVSGRSNLAWEDAIRLDLYYVENWSVAGDIAILWRTLKAVVAPGDNAF